MKNSVKFFFGGIVAASIVFGAFAFTTKQKENKEYLVVRVKELAGKKGFISYQTAYSDGKVEYNTEEIKEKEVIFSDKEAKITSKYSLIINKFALKGYRLVSSNSSFSNGGIRDFFIVSTLIFEK